jgi:DNA-binding NarL/FixJ family response regulator
MQPSDIDRQHGIRAMSRLVDIAEELDELLTERRELITVARQRGATTTDIAAATGLSRSMISRMTSR